MHPFLPQTLAPAQRRLLGHFSSLSPQDQATLLAFAEFLAGRREAGGKQAPPSGPVEPRSVARPDNESVVAAIRRLSQSYFMLDRQAMLSETASLMTANVLHGRPAQEVIDDLEAVFEDHYRRYLEEFERQPHTSR